MLLVMCRRLKQAQKQQGVSARLKSCPDTKRPCPTPAKGRPEWGTRTRHVVPPAKAGSESRVKHLDASLKASSTRTAQNREFFSG